jgi:hypothetical protein
MEWFYILTIIVSLIVFIITLAVIGSLMSKSQSQKGSFPSSTDTCPTYWSISSDNKCIIPPKESLNIGNNYKSIFNPSMTPGLNENHTMVDFSDPGWSNGGKSATCAKYHWSKSLGILWDGISNSTTC